MPWKNTANDAPSFSGRVSRVSSVRSMQVVLALVLVMVAGCARAPLKGPENSMRAVSAPDLERLKDDLPIEPLLAAIETQIKYLELNSGNKTFMFAERVIPQHEYIEGLKRFVELARNIPNQEDFFKAIEDEFQFYEVYGDPEWGDVFMTSYYEPILKGSKRRTKELTQPLYMHPTDMVLVDLSVLDSKFAGEKRYRARVENGKLQLYYSREDIDSKQALKGKKLELYWVDPVDAFILQIQGSGTIELGRGKTVRVGYAEQNGHRYEAVGKFFKTVIPPDEITLHTIEAYLRSLPKEEMQQYLNYNPSYVFFREMDRPAITMLGVSATDGRTIATDAKYFPKGALGFLVSTKPKFDTADATVAASFEPMARFVLDQDVGGAIKGGGRLDLFWGRGAEAKRSAGVMKQRGKLYYIAPREK